MRKKNFVIKIFDSTTNFWLSFLCSRREKVLIERKSEEHTYANFCLITFEAFKEGWKWFFFKDENQILATVHLNMSWLGFLHQSFQGSSFICSSTTATFLTGRKTSLDLALLTLQLITNYGMVCDDCLFVMAPRTSLERPPSIRRQLCRGPGY